MKSWVITIVALGLAAAGGCTNGGTASSKDGGGGSGGGAGGGGGAQPDGGHAQDSGDLDLVGGEGDLDAAGESAGDDGGGAPMCDPVKQDCPDGMKCAVKCLDSMMPGFGCVADTGGKAGMGDMCQSTADCMKGFQCVSSSSGPGPAGPRMCRKYCSADADCGGGTCEMISNGMLSGCGSTGLDLQLCM